MREGPVAVVALCCVIRDPDRTQLERAEAVEKLVLANGLRSLRETIDIVYGDSDDMDYVGPTPDAFDILADTFRATAILAGMGA